MARPRSEDRRNAILSAATRVIASQGLGAATATIAKEAGVSNGSLFVYFDTKATLLNALYVGLKTESERREQLLHMWDQWLSWAVSFPEKRRALAHLDVSDAITAESQRIVSNAFSGIADLLNRSRDHGPMWDAPLGFVLALMTAIAEATIDAIISDPTRAEANRKLAFDAMWRMLA